MREHETQSGKLFIIFPYLVIYIYIYIYICIYIYIYIFIYIKYKIKNWLEVNDNSRGTYNTNSQFKFTTWMLKSPLCDYNDAYILIKSDIIVVGTGATEVLKNTETQIDRG